MTYDHILHAMGPCGLSCEKCFAHVDGDIRKYSLKLKEKLGNFDVYAKRFETLLDNPIFKKYDGFSTHLLFGELNSGSKEISIQIAAVEKNYGLKEKLNRNRTNADEDCSLHG